jgi:hypothetical protein
MPSSEGLEAFEALIEARGAEPLLEVGGTPAVFAQPVGKGWALYLNVLFDRYPRLRQQHFGGGAYRALLSGLLLHLGVRPGVELRGAPGRPVGPARIARCRLGESDIVGVLLDPTHLETVHGADGVSAYLDPKEGGVVPEDVEVRLQQTGDIVNVRTGERYGRTDRVRVSVAPGDALILAASPLRATLRVEGPHAARRGDHIRLAIASSAAGKHLLRCHVYGPDGRFLPEYARNLLVSGTDTTFVVPTALDDPVGSYRVKITDILGGASADAALELR